MFEEWNVSISNYEENFDITIDNFRKSYLDKLKMDTIEKLKQQLKELFYEKFENVDENFWFEVNLELILTFQRNLIPLKSSLIDDFKLPVVEADIILEAIEVELYNLSFKTVERKTKDFSSAAVEYFKKQFWFDEGLPRKWSRIEETEIDSLFKSSKKLVEGLFSIFTEFKVLKLPLKTCKKNNYKFY